MVPWFGDLPDRKISDSNTAVEERRVERVLPHADGDNADALHKSRQRTPSCWIVTAGVDALVGADQGDAKPLQLIEDQSQVRQRPVKPVQLVHEYPGHLAAPDLAHHGVVLWSGDPGPGLMLDEEPDF